MEWKHKGARTVLPTVGMLDRWADWSSWGTLRKTAPIRHRERRIIMPTDPVVEITLCKTKTNT